jgi:hypothetical protein
VTASLMIVLSFILGIARRLIGSLCLCSGRVVLLTILHRYSRTPCLHSWRYHQLTKDLPLFTIDGNLYFLL